MKRLLLSLVMFGCGGPAEVASTQDANHGGGGTTWVDGIPYTIISSSVDPSVSYPLKKIDTLVQAGNDSRNRFVWSKVYKLYSYSRGSIVLAPTAYADIDQYLVGPPGQSFAEKVAMARYDVHIYSTRQALIPAGACASGAFDCSILSTWGYRAHARDLDFIRRQVGGRPAVGGWSSGAGYSIAAVNERPSSWAGLFVGDMLMSTSTQFTIDWATNTCATYTGYIDAGFTYDDQTQAFLKSLVYSSEADWVSFAGSDLGAFFGAEGLRLSATNDGVTLAVASFDRVFDMISTNPDQESLTMLRDEACAWAGDDQFTDNLGYFSKPILAVKHGMGFGPLVQHTLDLTSSNRITVLDKPAFGHLDTLTHADQNGEIVNPMLNWLGTLRFD